MKVYEVGTGYTPIPAKMGAATEIVVEELTKAFIKKNIDVSVVDIAAKERLKTDLPIVEVKIPKCFMRTDIQLGIMHKMKRVVYSVSLSLVLKKMLVLSEENVIIHFHNQYNLFFFLKLVSPQIRKKCFIIYTNHSYIWHGKWSEIKDIVKRRYFQEIVCMKKANKVFVLNKMTENILVNHLFIPKNKLVLIDNGVNTNTYFPFSANEIKKLKIKLNLREKRIFLQVGSVCDRKNQLGAIELLCPVLKKYKDVLFLYAGGIIDLEYHRKIIKFADDNNISDKIKYMGEVEPGKTLNELYNLAEALIFPSKSEGFSLVIIEAMSAGIPVIINRTLQFKLANICYQYKDNVDFCSIIENEILNAKRHELKSKELRTTILENYSWDRIADDYCNSWRWDKGGKQI